MIIDLGDGSVFLLTCSIPDLHFQMFARLILEDLFCKGGSHGGCDSDAKLVLDEATADASFADSRGTNYNYLGTFRLISAHLTICAAH